MNASAMETSFVQSQSPVDEPHSTRVELDAAGDMVVLPWHTKDLQGAVMRREVHTDGAVLVEQASSPPLDSVFKNGDLMRRSAMLPASSGFVELGWNRPQQHTNTSVNTSVHLMDASLDRDSGKHYVHGTGAVRAGADELPSKQHATAKSPQSSFQVLFAWLFAMPDQLNALFVFAALILIVPFGIIAFVLYQQWLQAFKEEQQAGFRQKVMSARENLAADGKLSLRTGIVSGEQRGSRKGAGKNTETDDSKFLSSLNHHYVRKRCSENTSNHRSTRTGSSRSVQRERILCRSGSSQACDGVANSLVVHDQIYLARAARLIQSAWRQWRSSWKAPIPGQTITMVCDILEGAGVSSANHLGGCDPLVECRIVRGDPATRLRGAVDKAPLLSAQTDAWRNGANPEWQQRLDFPGLKCEASLYVQFVLWDCSLARRRPIGHVAMPLTEALVMHGSMAPARTLKVVPLPGSGNTQLEANISVRLAFLETFKYKLIIARGSWLPKVREFGTVSSYVEAFVFSSDPGKSAFLAPSSSLNCLWRGRTHVVCENVDPVWDTEFDFSLSCESKSLWVQFVLWDSNSPLPDVALGQAIVEVPHDAQKEETVVSAGAFVDHTLHLESLSGHTNVAADLSRARLSIQIGHKSVIAAA